MLNFQLFRLKVYPRRQLDLFEGHINRRQALVMAIDSLPEAELRRGSVWHIGNVRPLDDLGLYFRIGRTSRSTVGVYRMGNFQDQEFESAPYSHVVLDLRLEVCAIARKTELAPKPLGIANRLIRLLNQSRPARDLGFTVDVGEITDPQDFLMYLQEAYAIPKFWITFSRPNDVDANRDFIIPFQKLVEESGGDSGKAELKGSNLKPQLLEELTRSAAATGNDAGATIYDQRAGRRVQKRLRGNTVTLEEEEDPVGIDALRRLLAHTREIYGRIRGKRTDE